MSIYRPSGEKTETLKASEMFTPEQGGETPEGQGRFAVCSIGRANVHSGRDALGSCKSDAAVWHLVPSTTIQ